MLLYLFERLIFRVGNFFHHWYRDGVKAIANYTVSFFAGLDRGFALRINVRYFFEPLYGDYTITGRIIGFLFRSIRVLLGLVAYIFSGILFLIAAVIWFLLPPFLIVYAIF